MSKEENGAGIFEPLIGPWYRSLKTPETAQNQLLLDLTQEYQKTDYGKNHHASEIKEINDYRRFFPVLNYDHLNPLLAEVTKGNYLSMLPEPLVCWVMTRGSTGPAKVLPATKKHIEQILSCGSRGLINYAIKNRDFDLLDGHILNLNFPSNVHTITIDGRETTYGYSSGTYAKLIPALDQVSLLPRQEDIDELGPGITKHDWEKRFELAYQLALDQKVTAAMGVTQVILSFANYIRRKHGKKPKDLWHMHALFCTSVRKIQFKYAPVLRKLFGEIPIIEIYSATEGVFAQQLDKLPYIVPNYDTYLFEVQTRREIKMLHELKRGEWGSLIISSCMFPRYKIGDLIESAGKNYFRVFGRENSLTVLEHVLYRSLYGWLT